MFVGLFIVVAGLETTVLTPESIATVSRLDLETAPVLSAVTAALSNLVSNVPAVLGLKPFIANSANPQRAWLIVAMASTLAGNFTLIGSVANLIVAQRARTGGVTIGFWTYFKVGAIEQKRGMSARRDLFCDFGKMQVHRLSVAGGQNKRRALAVAWADGAKHIGRGRTLIGRRGGPGAAPCPTAGDLVFLADARLVGKPDFYVAGIDAFLLRDGLQTGGEHFLNTAIAPSAYA